MRAERDSLFKVHHVISSRSETKQTEILDLFGPFDCKESKQIATNAISINILEPKMLGFLEEI